MLLGELRENSVRLVARSTCVTALHQTREISLMISRFSVQLLDRILEAVVSECHPTNHYFESRRSRRARLSVQPASQTILPRIGDLEPERISEDKRLDSRKGQEAGEG